MPRRARRCALDDFALDALATRPEVEHINTSLVFDLVVRRALPNLSATSKPEPGSARRRKRGRR